MEPGTIVVIGGSAGAVEALTRLVRDLPGDLPAAVFVVIHTFPVGDSLLPAILSREGALTARVAADGEPISSQRIYVAPPNWHLLIDPGRVKLSSGPKESGHRPAIDPLFRSAAQAYGDRVIGVILSGTLDDGSRGLQIIRRHGGSAMVQDPEEALFGQMPGNAIDAAHPQHVAPVAELARLIATHSAGPGGGLKDAMSQTMNSNGGETTIGADDTPGTPTGIACPECHGVIWAADDDEGPEFRCRVGHAYTAEALLEAHADSVEAALWAGARALQEQASLTKHMARRADRRGDHLTAHRMMQRSTTADEHASRIQSMLLKRASKPA